MVLLTSTAVVMIPQLLALLGIQWIDYVTFNSALYFPRVMQDIGNSAFSQMQSFYFIVYIAALLLLCFVLIRFLYRNLVVSKKESALWTKRANRKEQKA